MKKETVKFTTVAEIEKKVAELRAKIRTANFAGVGMGSKNVKEIGGLKKEIARLETSKTALNAATK